MIKENILSGINSKYDIVVIGSGMAGMTAANKLSKEGYSTLLIEQHYRLGGLAGWFRRGPHIFDISLHGFPASMKSAFRVHWNKKIANSIIKIGKIKYDNPQFSFDTSYESNDFGNKLEKVLKLNKKTIDNFFTTLRIIRSSNDYTLTVRDFFSKLSLNRNDVIRALLEPITYANDLSLEDPAIIYAIVFSNFMSSGVYTFRGGTYKMIQLMTEELLKNKVDIIKCAKAERIEVKANRVNGVAVNGKTIKAKAVISNTNLVNTINNLVGGQYFTSNFLKKTTEVRMSSSACQVYLGIKKQRKISYIGDIIFASSNKRFSLNALLSKKTTNRSISIYYPNVSSHLDDDYTIVSTSKARYSDWHGLPDKQYQQDKRDLIESTVDYLERYIPRLKSKIDYAEAATPDTFERYTLHNKGASFGTKFEGLKISLGLSKQISGLFHAGSVGILTSGWLGTVNYGASTSYLVKRYLNGMKK